MEMLPIEKESFKDDGVMVGLWRQCIRYLPDKYECYENLNQNIEDNDDPLCKCTCVTTGATTLSLLCHNLA